MKKKYSKNHDIEIEEQYNRIAQLEQAIDNAKNKIESENHCAEAYGIANCALCDAVYILKQAKEGK